MGIGRGCHHALDLKASTLTHNGKHTTLMPLQDHKKVTDVLLASRLLTVTWTYQASATASMAFAQTHAHTCDFTINVTIVFSM